MKKTLLVAAGFISLYLLFAIVFLPLNVVLKQVTLPNNVHLGQVSGSIWHSKIMYLTTANVQLNQLEIQLSALSLLTFDPKLHVKFGDPLVNGPEGELELSGLLTELNIENATITVAANEIAQQLALPVPVTAHEYIELNVEKFVQGAPVCQQLTGKVKWSKAAVSAFDEKVNLGKLAATLSCDNGEVLATLDENNELGLSFAARVGANAQTSGEGYLTPNDNLPKSLQQVLPFLGRADGQGRYRLKL